MRVSTIDLFSSCDGSNGSPMRLEQRYGVANAVFFLMLLVPAMVAIAAPVVVLCSLAMSDPGIRLVLSERAGSTLLVVLGLGVWATLWGIPVFRFLGQLSSKRVIEISGGEVRVFDRSITGRREWSCPLGSFEGLSHNLRTTISGACHELVLVHRDDDKCVRVHGAPVITQTETLLVARILGQQVLSGNSASFAEPPRQYAANSGRSGSEARLAA